VVTLANDQDIPVISTLRADLVPQREMAIRKWYSASSCWYYHRRALPGEHESSRRFYQLVDPQLRNICRLLHRNGIHTTPSCQGHFHDREHYQKIWESLEREEQLIRAQGVVVRDSGGGREFVFRACTYELPWPNFEQYYSLVAVEQTQGFLGILLPRNRHAVVCELHNRPFRAKRAWIRFDGELSCLLGASVFGATVQPHDPNDRDRLWEAVGDYLHEILHTADASEHLASARIVHRDPGGSFA
jgi:hypothetical protein